MISLSRIARAKNSLRKGAAALSDQELLAVLLGKGTPGWM